MKNTQTRDYYVSRAIQLCHRLKKLGVDYANAGDFKRCGWAMDQEDDAREFISRLTGVEGLYNLSDVERLERVRSGWILVPCK